jgi:hypothetical protein
MGKFREMINLLRSLCKIPIQRDIRSKNRIEVVAKLLKKVCYLDDFLPAKVY